MPQLGGMDQSHNTSKPLLSYAEDFVLLQPGYSIDCPYGDGHWEGWGHHYGDEVKAPHHIDYRAEHYVGNGGAIGLGEGGHCIERHGEQEPSKSCRGVVNGCGHNTSTHAAT